MNNPWDWDKFTFAWAVWLLWFVFWETWALLERKADAEAVGETLSEHVWWLRNSGGSFAFFIIGAIVLWLAWHFIVEGRV